jgi:hypothetical protein
MLIFWVLYCIVGIGFWGWWFFVTLASFLAQEQVYIPTSNVIPEDSTPIIRAVCKHMEENYQKWTHVARSQRTFSCYTSEPIDMVSTGKIIPTEIINPNGMFVFVTSSFDNNMTQMWLCPSNATFNSGVAYSAHSYERLEMDSSFHRIGIPYPYFDVIRFYVLQLKERHCKEISHVRKWNQYLQKKLS